MDSKKIIIVPHTHWDREWYLPFQRFRHMLVDLVDDLLDILKDQDYQFMLDGQTVVLEDYFEIREERRNELLDHIRSGKIAAGPWYLLPDQWLVGGESLIRNIEYSHDLATQLRIPQMQIGYMPDMFGHTSAIPQIMSDLTDFKAAVLWRGIPPEIMTVLFNWKSHSSSKAMIPTVYLPGGYGNASRFAEEYKEFTEMVKDGISFLEPFSPVPVYLLMNGSDHLFPQAFVQGYVDRMKNEGADISLSSLDDYVNHLQNAIDTSEYSPPIYSGEFRSAARSPLLQDTYSARMWIKIWNQNVEDLLIKQVEPISTYLWFSLNKQYPTSYLKTAWKWLLRNHPHDSICGCSVDTTHEEMKSRFSWAETIAEGLLDKANKALEEIAKESNSAETSVIAYNSGGSKDSPVYIEFSMPKHQNITGLQTPDGEIHSIQRLESKDDILFETTVGMRMAKMGMNLLPGRKFMNFYINGIDFYDGENPEVLELRFNADFHLVGELDWEKFKHDAHEVIDSKKYKKLHVIAARPTQNVYAANVPLRTWAFTELVPVSTPLNKPENDFLVNQNQVDNQFYVVSFNKDGSLSLFDKELELSYDRLHFFEDYGDRGDEYTFGRVEPEKVDVKKVKRQVTITGPVVAEIRQDMEIELYESLDNSREKRTGKVRVPIESTFRFYRNSPRIEVTTRFTNRSKDHRFRICFGLPFTAEKSRTATHFGVIERDGKPEKIPDEAELEKTNSPFPERPSGIQAQKRFIRIDDDKGAGSITVFNTGLPEAELVNGNRIAVTLIRSIGWLSLADIPERPLQAGPSEETPGAQEIGTEYEYHYGFAVHTKEQPIYVSDNIAEAASEKALALHLNRSDEFSKLLTPLIQLDNPNIKISSMRVRNDGLLVTMYNIENDDISVTLDTVDSFKTLAEVKIDGKKKQEFSIEANQVGLVFSPHEIKMCLLS